MEHQLAHNNVLEIRKGDLTKEKTGAIVNAANGSLMGGGGVDGAIHRAAGGELLEACKQLRENELDGARLPAGEAVITKGYNLQAACVIHTVGPVWHGGSENEEAVLESCYRKSLQLAADRGLKSIAFPSISTGAYGFPVERAARIAISTIERFLEEERFGRVLIVPFSEHDLAVYTEALE